MKRLCASLALISVCACDSEGPAEPGKSLPALRNKIVFAKADIPGRSGLYVVDPDGSNLTALTADTTYNDCPGISPDGRQISFVRRGAVYVMKVDGTDERVVRPLQNGATFYRCPAWSPHGDKLAFIAMVPMVKAPSPGAIYLIDIASGTSTTVATGANYSGLEWSHDATRLLVGSNSYTAGGPYDFRVSVLSLTGTRIAQVVANYWNLSWAPDGSKFAYQCGTSALGVCVANVDGSNVRMLTSADTVAFDPKWSPDGKMIAYSSGQAIYVMNADGSSKNLVAAAAGASDMMWSPDSRHIAFTYPGQVRVGEVYFASDICVVGADGVGFKRLTNLPAISWMPVWSPQ